MFYSTIKYTKLGKILLTVINDREMSSALGINVNRFYFYFYIWLFIRVPWRSNFSAYDFCSAGIGVEVIVLAFAVVVTGGLGSVSGAAIGALFIGFARTMAIFYAPQLELFIVFLL